jgi:Patatin-like phospholipase
MRTTARRRLAPLALVLLCTACAAGRGRTPERTCLVLSVGGTKGLAHLGAIDALKAKGQRIDCVVGTSMGAVMGSLYASAPQEDLRTRYRRFYAEYARQTWADARTRGLASAAIGLATVLLTGGSVTLAAAVGALTGLGGLGSLSRLDHARFERTLEVQFAGARIETLPVPFATLYQRVNGGGLERVVAREGDLAHAVAASANNPLLFEGTELKELDPGADRVSAVPVHDACALFPRARLLTLNVTGEPAFYGKDLPCEVVEIRIGGAEPPLEALEGEGDAFERAYEAGFDATRAALER